CCLAVTKQPSSRSCALPREWCTPGARTTHAYERLEQPAHADRVARQRVEVDAFGAEEAGGFGADRGAGGEGDAEAGGGLGADAVAEAEAFADGDGDVHGR